MTTLVAMMADNVEHVITYWLIFDRFHSPALAGFAVVSHWAPFLLFGITFGALADRFDCRRIIQAGQCLFIVASFTWAALFLTNTLEAWHAAVLLVVHGMAGALWSPAAQLYLYDIVGREELPSGVRLEATARQIGILFGPAVGGGLLLVLGAGYGLLANCLLYLPLIIWLFITPFTGHTHRGGPAASANALALSDALRTLRDLRRQPVILAMVVLGGASSFLVGNAYSAQMPAFAADLAGGTELGYSALLTANGLGAVVAGFTLEWSSQLRRPGVAIAIGLAIAWGLALAVFAVTSSFALALVALFAAGSLQLGYSSLAQTIVQLEAPPDRRGRVIGLFSMASSGLRVGSGLTIGVLGALVGIHASLLWSALGAAVICVALFVLVRRQRTPLPTG